MLNSRPVARVWSVVMMSSLLLACSGVTTPPPQASYDRHRPVDPGGGARPTVVTTAPSNTLPPPTPVEPVSTSSVPPEPVDLDDQGLVGVADLTVSASLWIEGRGEIWSIGPDTELFPASTQKLLTAAGALEILDPDHRFGTRVVGADVDGMTELYLVAGGDPELRSSELERLARTTADALAGDPVRAVHVDSTHFEPHRRAPGWQDWHIPTYTGPLSAFVLDDNRWTTEPAYLRDPALGNTSRFVDLLVAAGVTIIDPEPNHATPPADNEVLAEHASPTVADLVATMLQRSDNEIAESLVREIDALRGGIGSTRAGLEHIVGRLERVGIRVAGTNGDGSGLSRGNRRSARQWQAFLVDIRKRPWFSRFEAALPVAGRTGTLVTRLNGPPTEGNVRAKTGTIIGGRALSGYLTTPAGPAVFSITVNGDRAHEALRAIDAVVFEFAAVE